MQQQACNLFRAQESNAHIDLHEAQGFIIRSQIACLQKRKRFHPHNQQVAVMLVLLDTGCLDSIRGAAWGPLVLSVAASDIIWMHFQSINFWEAHTLAQLFHTASKLHFCPLAKAGSASHVLVYISRQDPQICCTPCCTQPRMQQHHAPKPWAWSAQDHQKTRSMWPWLCRVKPKFGLSLLLIRLAN